MRVFVAGFFAVMVCSLAASAAGALDTVEQMGLSCAPEWLEAYDKSPLAAQSKDYVSRFSRDSGVVAGANETLIEGTWRVVAPSDADPLVELMARELIAFLKGGMNVGLALERSPRSEITPGTQKAIVLLDSAVGPPSEAENFTIRTDPSAIWILAQSPRGVRDGVVKLMERIGLRRAPLLAVGEVEYRLRIKVRLGRVPLLGTYRDVALMGNNAVVMGYENLYAISSAKAIPELTGLQNPELLGRVTENVKESHRYGLKAYLHVRTTLAPGDAPVFLAHPETKGANLDFGKPGEYTLCSEDPLVQRYLSETVETLFRRSGLDGIMAIVGGEEFYHCFMRAAGAAKGHTNCQRCEAIGAETAVAHLLNIMGEAARRAKPDGEVVAWPYSAGWCWSADSAQLGMIERMKPGTALLTEPEKDETIRKPEGIAKVLWDYSIDMTGVGARAKSQVAACKASGIPVYLKSDHEHAYEAPRMPSIPCMDLWWDRARALATSGTDGAWIFSYAYRPCYASSSTDVGALHWWDPALEKEEALGQLAARVAGGAAGPHLREAWRRASAAVAFSPELPKRYFMGPMCLGPVHPMCADPKATLPDMFYLGSGEARTPLFDSSPSGDAVVLGGYYRRMEAELKRAVEEMSAARPLVPETRRTTFDAEDYAVRYLYATARTTANFYEACPLRDRVLACAEQGGAGSQDLEGTRAAYARWRAVLLDERSNATEAAPIAQADVRLDACLNYASTYELIRAKLAILDQEIREYLPRIGKKCGVTPAE